jgi:uncharacterized protein YjiS (DUF1127 family)
MRFPYQWSANVIAGPNKVHFGLAYIIRGRWDRRISQTTAVVAELWSRIACEREIRRMRRAWATIEARTLKDIGISRWEIAYGGFDNRPAAAMSVAQLYEREMRRTVVRGPQSQAAFPECPML